MLRIRQETSCQMDRWGCSQMGSFPRVFCNVWAYVSCRGYVGILQRAQFERLWIKVASRIRDYGNQIVRSGSKWNDQNYSSLTELNKTGLSGTFVHMKITQSSSGRKTRGAFFVARQPQKPVDGRPWGWTGILWVRIWRSGDRTKPKLPHRRRRAWEYYQN